MTLLEVIDTTRDLLAEPLSTARSFPDNSSGFWQDTQLMRYHNMIQTELQNELAKLQEDYFITQTTIALTTATTYTLPGDFLKMRRIVGIGGSTDDSNTEIRPISMNDDRPGYYLHGGSIVISDSSILASFSSIGIHYAQRVADITAASSCSILPNEFHTGLVWGSVKLALSQQQTPNEFAVVEFENQKKMIRQSATQRQSQRSRSVQRSKW